MAARVVHDRRGDGGTTPSASSRRWPRILLMGGILAAVGAFYASGLWQHFTWQAIRAEFDVWQARVDEHLLLAAALFFLVYAAVTALSLPVAAALSLVAGALFGRLLGTIVVSGAATIGATLAFLSSRYLFRDWVQGRFGDRLRRLNEGIERDGAYYLFLLRLVPAVPFFAINLGMGLTPIGVPTYAAISWLGMLPGAFLYVNAGTALRAVESPGDVLSPTIVLSLAALGVVPLVLRKLLRWRQAVREARCG